MTPGAAAEPPAEENFADLLRRTREGDRAAFAELFSRRRARLLRIVHFRLDKRIAGRVDVDDILQESYLAAEQRIDSFEGDAPEGFFIWLRLVVGQTMIDIHRRHVAAQSRDVRREYRERKSPGGDTSQMLHLSSFLPGDFTTPSSLMNRADRSDRLAVAIEGLSGVDQEMLALRHYEELTNGEVAVQLGLSEQAASVRYVRALGRLRKELVSRYGPDAEQML